MSADTAHPMAFSTRRAPRITAVNPFAIFYAYLAILVAAVIAAMVLLAFG